LNVERWFDRNELAGNQVPGEVIVGGSAFDGAGSHSWCAS